jgi:2-iminobutanoate/2-iminopropanoate deaminase
MEVILTERAPRPVGPYSQAVVAGGFVFVSGQGPLDRETGRYIPQDIASETRLVLEHLKAILDIAGSDLGKVVKVTVYLRDMDDFSRMNAVYAEYFADRPPARTTIQAGALPLGIKVEMDCIAAI